MIATMNLTLRGTPFIFQGQELGMPNARFDSIQDYRDIDTKNVYAAELKESKDDAQKSVAGLGIYGNHRNNYLELTLKGAEKDIMEKIRAKSRDNSRAPMEWDSSEKAGFTTGTPWIEFTKDQKSNKKYAPMNVEAETNRPDSVLNHYKKMIKIRKENPVLTYGDYELLKPDKTMFEKLTGILNPERDKIFAYTRTLKDKKALIVMNYSEKSDEFSFKDYGINPQSLKLLINSNTGP